MSKTILISSLAKEPSYMTSINQLKSVLKLVFRILKTCLDGTVA